MPRGTVKPWPFSTRNLVTLVVNDTDFRNQGYVWGFDGLTHYCFVDPQRYGFEIWEKTFHRKALLVLGINIGLGLIFGALAGPMAGITAALAAPTLPAVLLWHYRMSAREQDGVVITNGPQMEYPGRIGSNQVMDNALASGAVGGIIGGISAALASKGLITFLGFTVSATVLAGAVAVLGTAANAMAFYLWWAGTETRPYDEVRSPSIADPGMPYGGWSYLSVLDARSIASWAIGSEHPPPGPPRACGGLNPIITKKRLIAAPGWGTVVWALIPLRPNGQPYDPPPPPESESALPSEGPPNDPSLWAKGLVLVAGSWAWAMQSGDLLTHGVVDAVATDGYVSPVLGCSGEPLVMECRLYMDPIQKYGFMCRAQQ